MISRRGCDRKYQLHVCHDFVALRVGSSGDNNYDMEGLGNEKNAVDAKLYHKT